MSARYGRRSGGRAESALGGDELNVLPRTRSGYRSRRVLPLAALALAAGVVALAPTPASPQDAPPPPVSTPSDPAAAREQLEGTRAELASEIDVLSADEAEIRAAVRELEANVRTAEAQRVDADRNVARAREEAAIAEQQAAEAAAWLDVVRAAVARMAVDAYVTPPSQTDLDVLESVDSATDEALKKTFIESRTGKDTDLLDELRRASADLAGQRERAHSAQAAAEASSAELDAKLAQLGVARAQQEGLVLGIQQRLESRLAEADALAAIDAQLADQIRSSELALVASLSLPAPTGSPGSAAGTPGAPSGPGSTSTTTPGSTGTTTPGSTGTTTPGSTGTTTAPTTAPPATTAPTSPPTTKPPTTTTTRPTNGPEIVSVRGIWVNRTIADDLDRMLAAAEADGIVLRGGGYRDPASQIALRKAHCGPTEYDIWQKPASQCSPPTAPPGKSMHEQGLAIDFTYNGKVITSRSSPGFVWLAANAAAYGFYNLPSEPWHWSINGH